MLKLNPRNVATSVGRIHKPMGVKKWCSGNIYKDVEWYGWNDSIGSLGDVLVNSVEVRIQERALT